MNNKKTFNVFTDEDQEDYRETSVWVNTCIAVANDKDAPVKVNYPSRCFRPALCLEENWGVLAQKGHDQQGGGGSK